MRSVLIAKGVEMPMLGFGTYKILGLEEMRSALDAALSAGYRAIDTAQVYQNEGVIGESLKVLLPKHGLTRKDLFITTKLSSNNMGEKDVVPSITDSLKKLQINYVDLCLIHYPCPGWTESQDSRNKAIRKEAWIELEKAKNEGLVKAIGVSNYEVRHLEEMNEYVKITPAVNQTEFHPYFTRSEVLSYCRSKGIHFQAFSSLGRNLPSLIAEPDIIRIAQYHSATPQQILIAFALCQGISALPKSAAPERIRSNFESEGLRLSEEEIATLMRLNKNHNITRCTPWDVL